MRLTRGLKLFIGECGDPKQELFQRIAERLKVETARGDSDDVDVFTVRHDCDGVDLDMFIERKRLKREIETLFKHSRKDESKKSLFFVVKKITKEVLFDIVKENVARGQQSTQINGVVMMGWETKASLTKQSIAQHGFPKWKSTEHQRPRPRRIIFKESGLNSERQ